MRLAPAALKKALGLSLFVASLSLAATACSAGEGDGAPEDLAATDDALTGNVTQGSLYTTTARVNLREGPSTSEDIILTMPLGATVKAIGSAPTAGFYQVEYTDKNETGWAFGNYLKKVAGSGAGEETNPSNGGSSGSGNGNGNEPVDDGSTGSFTGRTYSGVTVLWQGNWEFLVKCDSYSRSKGRVVFFCDENPSRSFVDTGAWIAVPRANFTSGLCGGSAKVCKNGKCIVAKVVEKSVTAGKWEGSTAVMKTLGVSTGFSGCSSSFGTASGATITMQR
jgi:hypothetical protein